MNDCSEKDLSFLERTRTIVSIAGGVEKLSRAAGMSSRVIGKYLAGKSEPNRIRLVALAKAVNVSVEWLATGDGVMSRKASTSLTQPFVSESPPPRSVQENLNLNEGLLLAILHAIEEILSKRKNEFPLGKKVQLISTLYKMNPALPLKQTAVSQIIEMIE